MRKRVSRGLERLRSPQREVRRDSLARSARRAVAAARRQQQAPERKRRSLRVWVLSAFFTLGATATAGAVALVTGVVGGEPSVPYGKKDEFGHTFPRRAIVIATSEVSSGRIEVAGYRMKRHSGAGSDLCIDIALPDTSRGGSCGAGIPRKAAGYQGTGSMDAPGPVLVTGATRDAVQRIAVRYKSPKGNGTRAAQLFEVSGQVADHLKTKPFIFYIAEIPPRARPKTAVARESNGAVAWRARFRDAQTSTTTGRIIGRRLSRL